MIHQCNGQSELRTLRLLLAVLTDHESAPASVGLIDAELDGCAQCWRAMAHWLALLVSGHFALQAGSNAKAADVVASGIARIVMPSN